jgi:hypothetical protein
MEVSQMAVVQMNVVSKVGQALLEDTLSFFN